MNKNINDKTYQGVSYRRRKRISTSKSKLKVPNPDINKPNK